MRFHGLLFLLGLGASLARADMVPASDPLFLGSVLDETWDTRNAVTKGYIEGMVPLSDVDLTVIVKTPGPVVLHFDTSIYPSSQAASAGPLFEVVVDGAYGDRTTVGPSVSTVSTGVLQPGSHRVRFVANSNTSSPRWRANDPQLARVTGVEIPVGSHLEKSQRPKAWFLAITDSIGEGILDMNTTTQTWRNWPAGGYSDADRAWPAETARLLHKSVCGYLIGGIGVVHPGTGVPFGAIDPNERSGKNDPWDHIFEGVARPFTTAPDFIILCVGTNECGTDPNTPNHGTPDPTSADAPFTANVETFFARVRAHPKLKTTPIYVSVPFTGCKRTALQKAVTQYRAKHPGEKHIELFDVAYGSPDLRFEAKVVDPLQVFGSTPDVTVNEWTLFGGLTKDRVDDADTIPSSQASDRTHPYAIATPAIGSVNAHGQLAEVIAPRLKAMLSGGAPPKTGKLNLGRGFALAEGGTLFFGAGPTTGGSAIYSYLAEKSIDAGKTWTKVGASLSGMKDQIANCNFSDAIMAGAKPIYRITVTDMAEPPATASQIIKTK